MKIQAPQSLRSNGDILHRTDPEFSGHVTSRILFRLGEGLPLPLYLPLIGGEHFPFARGRVAPKVFRISGSAPST
ncbi:hypothetical protein ATY79_17430 [Rhizobium sp. R693]|nr:hypothetical protein ATY79_17430 [Rhizobium sp. R693]